MKPMFQWRHFLDNQGQNEQVINKDVWRIVGPIRAFSPSVDLPWDESNTFDYASVFPAPAQTVIVARREATVITTGGSETAGAAAIAALGAWEDVTPHQVFDFGTSISIASGGYSYTEGGIDYYEGYAEETKIQIRIAPPYSSRAIIQYQLLLDGSPTVYDIEYGGIAGTSYMGIPRCIPTPLESPLVDSNWIYLLEEPLHQTAVYNQSRSAEILFANSYRPPASP
jgi:hypothetical protein